MIKFYQRQVYGNTLLYPANAKARALCQALGTKTLNGAAWGVIKALELTTQLVHEHEAEK